MLAPVLLILGLFRMAAAVPFGDGSLVNTRLGVTLIYGAFQIAFSVWMLAAYFAAIPRDIEEAAWIDGCGRLRAVWHMFVPLAVPAIAVCALVAFVWGWNEYVVALTMLRDPDKQTVTLQVANLVVGRYSVEWNQVMAATLVATLPVAVVFAALQRFLVRGLTLGAVK
ncbi:MAG: carbohydrate ABC transporter permease [Acetobacteraceae bacterium]|nr:carbohydrate ABC transporter permease [Acetobacteraceae bacterium]